MHQASTARVNILRLLVLILIGANIFLIQSLNQAGEIYGSLSASITHPSPFMDKYELGSATINIPTYDLFSQGNIWALVSKSHPLKGEFGEKLVSIPVAHGDASQPMSVAVPIVDPLRALVTTAKSNGIELMVSSAYRSLDEQRQTYDSYVKKYGTTTASQYVAPVGASEHHTGLAVDMSSVSEECSEDSNACSLSVEGAEWLKQHASLFGFIQRYPEGDQEITGVSFEPWHYRFVGTVMARAMQDTDLTYDQVVQKIAPGYAAKPRS